MAKIVTGVALVAGMAVAMYVDPALVPFMLSSHLLEAGLSIGASLTIGGIADELRGGPGTSFSTRQPAASRQVIYGQSRVSGTVIYESTTGHQLNQVVVWASHKCQSIDVLYVDGRELHITPSMVPGGNDDGGTYFDVAGNKYSFGSEVAAFNALGDPAGYWFSQLNAQDPSKWDSTCTLNGICATYFKTKYDANKFSGIPGLKAAIHGKADIYDPRIGARSNPAAYVWTDNAALIIADLLCNKDYGVGCDYSTEIDEAQLIAAANVCDELVPLANGLNEKRYTINGFFDFSAAPGDTLNSMLMSCEGRISYSGGMWKIFPAAWYGTSLVFDENDLTGPVKWTPKRKFRDLCNAVRGTYITPVYPYAVTGYDRNHKDINVFDGQYQPCDAPEYAQDLGHGYTSDVNLAADGNIKLYGDRRYQFVTSCATVQRLMKIFLLRNRYQGSGTLELNLGAYRTQAQDCISLNFSALGFANKLLEVSSFHFVPKMSNSDPNQAPTLTCRLDVCETDPSIYTWSTVEERGVLNTASPTREDSLQVQPPTGLALVSGSATAIVGVDGVTIPRIHATWTEPNDPFVTTGGKIAVQLQKVGDPSWKTVAMLHGTDVECYIEGVVCGQQYNVQILAIRASGASSGFVFAGPHTVSTTISNLTSSTLNNQGSTIASQPIVINFSVTATGVNFSWANQSSLRPDGSTLSVVGSGSSPIVLTDLTASTTYYSYWRIQVSDGTVHMVNGDPPPTTPSGVLALQMANDGYIPVGVIKFTTTAAGGSGGGTGGGGDACPEENEPVEVLRDGVPTQVRAIDAQLGEPIRGKDLRTGEKIYRKIIGRRSVPCATWRIVKGKRVSPCEPVLIDGKWMPAFKAPGATLDTMESRKVEIMVLADDDGSHNYDLLASEAGGEDLTIHNYMISQC